MVRRDRVERPTKKSEFDLRFATRQAEKGWVDLKATMRNSLTDAWDVLTRSPQEVTPKNYPLRGELGFVVRNGEHFTRWQHKPVLKGSARIWFFVVGQTVFLEEVHAHHPNQTK